MLRDQADSPQEQSDAAASVAAHDGAPDRGADLEALERVPIHSRIDRLASWSPSRRPARVQVRKVPFRHTSPDHLDGPKDPAAWSLVSITAADDLGHVRSGMTYSKDYGTSACLYEKAGRVQFLEGPNEPAVADFLEMSPRFLKFQFQPLDMAFRRADGLLIHKYPDIAIEYDDNTVGFGEIKSNRSWFNAPGIRRPLERMDAALASVGLDPLLRIQGEPFRRDPVVEAHQLAMDARLTAFDAEGEAATARDVVRKAGGRASFGSVAAALGGAAANAEDKLYAMLLRRVVSFELFSRPTADTPVTLPRPARAFALHETLRRFQRKAA